MVSGGVDIRLFDALDGPAAAMFAGLVDIERRVEALPCPTVFAAHALTPAWAFELALACDLLVASEKAAFGLIEATVGFDAAAREPAARLAAGPTVAHAATTQVLATFAAGGTAAADAAVPEIAGALVDTADLHGALRTFLASGPGHSYFTGH